MDAISKTLPAGIALSLLLTGTAQASSRDRNHDRLPDRWERAHHLSLHVNQSRRDQDHDGLDNRGEYRAGMNPRDRDSDDDGVRDGRENTGSVSSFAGGVLTITLAQGGTLTAKVTDATRIECRQTAHASDDHGHNGGGGGSGGGHNGGSDDTGGYYGSPAPATGSGGSGDDHGSGGETEPGDDHGNHTEPGDDHGTDAPTTPAAPAPP